jgi:myo-inositol-1(or 4)-monophosphatase
LSALDPLLLATAVETALAAGRIHRQYFRQNPAVTKKGRIDLVTAADLEVERMCREVIGARFPSHAILGEEGASGTGPVNASHRWIIDPVDGTTNFAHGLALFCISIGLEIDGALALGVVYDPIAEELFTAETGQGARLNGSRLQVSACTALVDAVVCTGFPYTVRDARHRPIEVFDAFLRETRAVRRLGSAALDMCYVAAGRLDGYWEERIQPWDIAGGAVIVREAGGQVSGLAGEPFDPFAGHVLVSNGRIHDDMRRLISEVRRPPSALS